MGNINIIVISAPLEEGWQGTPDEFRQEIFSTLTFQADGAFLTGQVGGAMPTQDVGIYIDGQDIYTWDAETSSYQPINVQPIGSLLPYLGAVAPKHYLLCDGGSYHKTDYPDLYALIGDSYKRSGDITDDFRVPDFQGRFPVGAGVGDYNPLGNLPPGDMREINLHSYGGFEWPRRKDTKHVNQPAANVTPGDSLVYTGVVSTTYTRSVPPYVGVNYIVRSK